MGQRGRGCGQFSGAATPRIALRASSFHGTRYASQFSLFSSMKIGKLLRIVGLLFVGFAVGWLAQDYKYRDYVPDLVQRQRGAHKLSPDKAWYAAIWDGYSELDQRRYAVLYIYDTSVYPDLRRKATPPQPNYKPYVRLAFPQGLSVGEETQVHWDEDSKAFTVEFDHSKGAAFESHRRLSYRVDDNTFALSEQER